ncbi:hypothetical protein J1N35_043879 [Gossypium stocksii]|uniref:Uncharacterized protein n=1 Tax=Gossypium stocksii TaxID=47602 RepID=A0A9D3U8E9_9ROSI|nr:hypothetical protein J1N35_043879 [Gossypium stocksii]
MWSPYVSFLDKYELRLWPSLSSYELDPQACLVCKLPLLYSRGSPYTQSSGGPIQRECTSKTSVEAKVVPYITKYEDMRWSLCARGIKILHFAYEFSIPKGNHSLNDTSDGDFLLPFHTLEAGFHLPLHLFFCSLLREYEIASRQLCGFF